MPTPETQNKSRFKGPTILLAISAALVLLGGGLCTVGGFTLEGTNTLTTNIGMATFWPGTAGLCIGVLWWLIALITRPK
jgi:hypothetical protein